MKFREDINALRAIAVASVVVFHFNHSWLPGGFAGVDVFFVISGFLMTMIVVKGLEKENFSILSFYNARVRRIIPALSVLCFALLVFGLFFIPPIDYLNLGKHAAASLSFVSNMVFWSESNYFNPSSNEKWLLHTWSLSVEWQFYLIYPLVLVFFNKVLSLRQLRLVILCGTVLAFLFSVFVTVKSSSAAYFLLPTRAWQMLTGGLVFLYPLNIKDSFRHPLQLTGLVLIISSFFLFTSSTPWPGYASLLPIVGACMVLVANDNSKLVSNNITHSLGKWSYSIYLWHWPIVVAGYYFELGPYWWLVGIPLSILLGALSFKYIESKTLKDFHLDHFKVLLRPLPFAVVVALSGVSIFYTNGLLNRFSQSEQLLVKSALEAKDDWNYPEPNMEVAGLKVRFIKGNSDRNILVMGASHIEQLYPYVESLNNEYNIYFLTQSGCFVTPSMKNPKWNCDNLQNYEKLLEEVKFEKVVTSFYSFNSYLPIERTERDGEKRGRIKEYDNFLNTLKRNVSKVFVIMGEPKGEEFDPILAIRKGLPNSIPEIKARSDYTEHEDALKQLKNIEHVEVIDPIKHLCENGLCKTRDEKAFFYRDYNHMRPWYSIKANSYLDAIFLT
ncbi:acyltransferase family protein [Alteromonas mediterranea]|uniref:acyltransferase family protein n=1 Tax=Alteromonas mediterranea TaxID=314275 RepID=UPI0012FCA04F|nr:acyltransferase family protein [Alteromonas mediterranea]QGX61525.1 acyltransferase family protein [Alteromonas mediterranea]